MASEIGLAHRRERADEKVRLALGRIATRLGTEFDDAAPRHRDANEEAVVQVETWAKRLDAIDAALHSTHASEGAVDLSAMTRAELNTYAVDLGIKDVDTLPNKDAVIAAITQLDAETAPDAPDGPPAGDSGEQDA